MAEGEDRRGLFHSIKIGFSGKKEADGKGGSMITSSASISYPFDVVRKQNVAPPGSPPDLYANRPTAIISSPYPPVEPAVSPKSARPISVAPLSPARSPSPPRDTSQRAMSPRKVESAASPRRRSPSRAASPRRAGASPPRPSSPHQRVASPRRRSPTRSKSPIRNNRSRSPRRVSPSRVRSPREDRLEKIPSKEREERLEKVPSKEKDREKDRDKSDQIERTPSGRAERAASPRRKSPVRTYSRPSQPRTPNSPSSSRVSVLSPPTNRSSRSAVERRADREREREKDRGDRDHKKAPSSRAGSAISDINIGPRERREHIQRSQRKAPREDARAVARHLSEKATVKTSDVRKRAADTGDLPFFGVTRVRPVNTARQPRHQRIVLKGGEGDEDQERVFKWTRSDHRALLRSGAKFDTWVEHRNLKPLLDARRSMTGRAMTMAIGGDELPPEIAAIAAAAEAATDADVTKEQLLSMLPVSVEKPSPRVVKDGKKKAYKTLPHSYWMRFVGRALPRISTPPSDLSPSPSLITGSKVEQSSAGSGIAAKLPVVAQEEGANKTNNNVTAQPFRTASALSPSSFGEAERLRNLLAGKGSTPVREDGVFVSAPSLISSTQSNYSAAARKASIQTAVQELLAPRPSDEQSTVKELIDQFLLAFRAYCSPAELLRLLEDVWNECLSEKLPESERVKQNILYLVWRWINTAYVCDFLKENGLPDPAAYKGLSALMLHMSDTHQQGLSKKCSSDLQIGELSEAPFPKDILDRPLPNRVSWIENRAAQILRNDFSIMTLPLKDVSRAFLLHDLNTYSKLRRVEMVARAYPRLAADLGNTGVLPVLTSKWNATQTWVSNELVSTPKLKERAQLLERFILLAEECLSESRNFHTFYAIMFGLKDPTVTRLKSTWQRLSADAFSLFKELDKETDFGRGYRSYRVAVQKQREDRSDLPVVPFIVVPLSDLVILASLPDLVDSEGQEGTSYNIAKASGVAKILTEFETNQLAKQPHAPQRELAKWLDSMHWDENDIAVIRQLPVCHLDRYKGITQDTLLELSKWVEPSSLAN